MSLVKPLISLIVLVVLAISLNTKFGSVPPLGKFFDPDAGFWANAERSLPDTDELNLDAIQGEVSVYFDERRVPHIFAESEYDLYFVQGYVTARDRLFQMEMQTYDAAGRLSERLGDRTLNRDLSTRRMGMPYGAEKAIELIKEDEKTWSALNAYSEGVNAYISSLSPKKYPIEYKILDFAPEEWTPIKTAHLLKNMTRTLAGGSNDDRTSNTMAYFGDDFIEKFFDVKPGLNDPIIPPSKTWDFDRVPVHTPDTLFKPASALELENFDRPEGVGSNNWAVSGEKTASGFPILSNDPHLGLTLPSIWYEVQLHAPGLNTYGVSLQGAPGVIIGFNENAAWGTTNTGADVMDWYEIKFKDGSKQEYWYDGEWKPTTMRVEEIKVRGQETVFDTVIYTHHGPVSEIESDINEEREPTYHALRWIAHEPSNDLKTFFGFNRMESYDDFKEAASHFVAPAQNFIFSNNEGDIATWISGKFPNKWKFQGRTVGDGTDPLYDWQGWIPTEHNPNIKNPERGFVSSANQESAAPDYPYYLDDDFAPFERGRRINELLAGMENITKEDIRRMQMDNYSYHAATILPEMLEWINRERLSDTELEILAEAEAWDYLNKAELKAPGIFRWWWSNFYNGILSDEYSTTDASLRWPSRDRLIEVIKSEPEFEFFDNIETEEVESRQRVVTDAFKETVEELTDAYGEFGDNWNWGVVINNDVDHIAFIPGFGAENVYSSGNSESINATRGSWGPSWRMVVELGLEVKGWGVYPGGASGNPGSPNYDSMLEAWRVGELYELKFMKEPPEEYLYELKFSSND
ncbi:MAG: penicillin acylase family protein [Balneolaceae bacterium]|nr:penicillin acylase family protein [Balneolaceae bacterium]MBO6545822.1 penicillin acylase family protein [Balneolaceae bacterium]MBO6647218.1 penicillin acylase family protein [Balneolaceae bacterium]